MVWACAMMGYWRTSKVGRKLDLRGFKKMEKKTEDDLKDGVDNDMKNLGF